MIASGLTGRSAWVMVLAVAVLGGGCVSLPPPSLPPIKPTLNVKLDERAWDASNLPDVTVQIVGIPGSELEQMKQYSMTTYWQHEDPKQNTYKRIGFETVLGPGKKSDVLKPNDQLGTAWMSKEYQSEYLFVAANYPRTSKDAPGDTDARRRIIPLNPWSWDNPPNEINIVIRPDGISYSPSAKTKP